eukprot:gene18677-biopygen6935
MGIDGAVGMDVRERPSTTRFTRAEPRSCSAEKARLTLECTHLRVCQRPGGAWQGNIAGPPPLTGCHEAARSPRSGA